MIYNCTIEIHSLLYISILIIAHTSLQAFPTPDWFLHLVCTKPGVKNILSTLVGGDLTVLY